MIRIGILGAAKIGPKAIIHPAANRKDCDIVAVAARDGDKARAYAAEHGIAHVETDYEALVRRNDLDLIYNALPPHRHADLTIAALEAGKAVLCEKPFAMNSELHKIGLDHKAIGQLLPSISVYMDEQHGLVGFGHLGDLIGSDLDAIAAAAAAA